MGSNEHSFWFGGADAHRGGERGGGRTSGVGGGRRQRRRARAGRVGARQRGRRLAALPGHRARRRRATASCRVSITIIELDLAKMMHPATVSVYLDVCVGLTLHLFEGIAYTMSYHLCADIMMLYTKRSSIV